MKRIWMVGLCLMLLVLGAGCRQADDRPTHNCTISITCETILDNFDRCKPEKQPFVPENGIILPVQTVEFQEGDSAFDLLERLCREQKIQMESSWTPLYNSAYIEGIQNLYEFDVGDGSGWVFLVNGESLGTSCSSYCVQEGDHIAWVYSCDFGNDVTEMEAP